MKSREMSGKCQNFSVPEEWPPCLHPSICPSLSFSISTQKGSYTRPVLQYKDFEFLQKHDVAIAGHNTTGPPWSVGCPAAVLQTTTTDASEQNDMAH